MILVDTDVLVDCLIAAMALGRASRLYSFNLKHFQVLPGLDVQPPYPRP